MTKDEIWVAVHAEREALAKDLAGLSEAQWLTPSSCGGWTVQDVVAHMTATAASTPPSFFVSLVGSGFNFDKVQAKGIAAQRGSTPAETLSNFKAHSGSTSHPPGPTVTWLGEALVHAEDVRQPLGIDRDYPVASATAVATFFKGSNLLIGSKRRIAGLKLRATDIDWQNGEGPEVRGPIMSLVGAMTGRRAAHAHLSGDGVALLATRP